MAYANEADTSEPVAPQLSFAIVAGVVLFACIVGICTRPAGQLAAFWPANAVLLGMMVRWPALASIPNWIGAFAAYMLADIATGGDAFIVLWLNLANVFGVMTGYALFQFMTPADRQLLRPKSVLLLLAVIAASSAATALAGGGTAKILFGKDFGAGLEFWFITELANSLIMLPPLLTFPAIGELSLRGFNAGDANRLTLQRVLPVLALLAAAALSVLVPGPGLIAYTFPVLVWCALTYSRFVTCVITAAACAFILISASHGWIGAVAVGDYFEFSNSLRLGIALLTMGPLAISIIDGIRRRVVSELAYVASHDELTGVLSRRAFVEMAQRSVSASLERGGAAVLMMIDADHFKAINDTHGHAAGDQVLHRLAARISSLLRPYDLFGRIGGEEFAVLLPRASGEEGRMIAERIRRAMENMALDLPSGESLRWTVSVGVGQLNGAQDDCLEALMIRADSALYRAKASGRNCVCMDN